MQSEVKKVRLARLERFLPHELLVTHAPPILLGKSHLPPWQSAAIPTISAKGIQTDHQALAQEATHPTSASIASL